jgi:hypothetical protein
MSDNEKQMEDAVNAAKLAADAAEREAALKKIEEMLNEEYNKTTQATQETGNGNSSGQSES